MSAPVVVHSDVAVVVVVVVVVAVAVVVVAVAVLDVAVAGVSLDNVAVEDEPPVVVLSVDVSPDVADVAVAGVPVVVDAAAVVEVACSLASCPSGRLPGSCLLWAVGRRRQRERRRSRDIAMQGCRMYLKANSMLQMKSSFEREFILSKASALQLKRSQRRAFGIF